MSSAFRCLAFATVHSFWHSTSAARSGALGVAEYGGVTMDADVTSPLFDGVAKNDDCMDEP